MKRPSKEQLQNFRADAFLIVGLGLVCFGVFRISISAGFIVTGILASALGLLFAPKAPKSENKPEISL